MLLLLPVVGKGRKVECGVAIVVSLLKRKGVAVVVTNVLKTRSMIESEKLSVEPVTSEIDN